MTLKAERARAIVDRFSEQRILVVGDLMLDRYIYGSVDRISPEAPVPVVQVKKETTMAGGACNVAWNVRDLGGKAAMAGIVGQDDTGAALKDVLKRAGIGVEATMEVSGIRTNVKTRIVAERQQLARVDWDNEDAFGNAVNDTFCEKVGEDIKASTGVIIEDYGKGVLEQKVVDHVLKTAAKAGILTGFDPKAGHALKLPGITVATPNDRETFDAAGFDQHRVEGDPMSDPSLQEAIRRVREMWNPELLLVTLGPAGMLLLSKEEKTLQIPTRAREVFDVSGAGDTVIAVSLLALASGASHVEAAELANYAAGVVCGKLGTATCTKEELLACFEQAS